MDSVPRGHEGSGLVFFLPYSLCEGPRGRCGGPLPLSPFFFFFFCVGGGVLLTTPRPGPCRQGKLEAQSSGVLFLFLFRGGGLSSSFFLFFFFLSSAKRTAGVNYSEKEISPAPISARRLTDASFPLLLPPLARH